MSESLRNFFFYFSNELSSMFGLNIPSDQEPTLYWVHHYLMSSLGFLDCTQSEQIFFYLTIPLFLRPRTLFYASLVFLTAQITILDGPTEIWGSRNKGKSYEPYHWCIQELFSRGTLHSNFILQMTKLELSKVKWLPFIASK